MSSIINDKGVLGSAKKRLGFFWAYDLSSFTWNTFSVKWPVFFEYGMMGFIFFYLHGSVKFLRTRSMARFLTPVRMSILHCGQRSWVSCDLHVLQITWPLVPFFGKKNNRKCLWSHNKMKLVWRWFSSLLFCRTITITSTSTKIPWENKKLTYCGDCFVFYIERSA